MTGWSLDGARRSRTALGGALTEVHYRIGLLVGNRRELVDERERPSELPCQVTLNVPVIVGCTVQ